MFGPALRRARETWCALESTSTCGGDEMWVTTTGSGSNLAALKDLFLLQNFWLRSLELKTLLLQLDFFSPSSIQRIFCIKVEKLLQHTSRRIGRTSCVTMHPFLPSVQIKGYYTAAARYCDVLEDIATVAVAKASGLNQVPVGEMQLESRLWSLKVGTVGDAVLEYSEYIFHVHSFKDHQYGGLIFLSQKSIGGCVLGLGWAWRNS
jgi:hypothetical protein